MKHILFTLIAMLFPLATKAQKGLHVADIFDGDIVSKTYMVENIIRGEQLSRYKLSYFRSIKFKATAEERRRIEALVNEDIRQSASLEQERQGIPAQKDGTVPITYAMMTFPLSQEGDAKQRRFLCYQCSPVRQEFAVTLVYMQGQATLDELRKIFKKK